jgi:hypothetical protein
MIYLLSVVDSLVALTMWNQVLQSKDELVSRTCEYKRGILLMSRFSVLSLDTVLNGLVSDW